MMKILCSKKDKGNADTNEMKLTDSAKNVGEMELADPAEKLQLDKGDSADAEIDGMLSSWENEAEVARRLREGCAKLLGKEDDDEFVDAGGILNVSEQDKSTGEPNQTIIEHENEVKKTEKFAIPQLVMLKLKHKPARKAGKRLMFGKEVKVAAKPASKVVKAFAASALKKSV